METQKIALKKHFTDLWKIKSCPICPEKINYDYNGEVSRQAQNVVACFFITRNEVKHGRT